MKTQVALFAAILLTSIYSMASTITPVWSESSFDDASYQCQQQNGQTIGETMETTTATGNQFYIVTCQRPAGDGSAVYVPAWSATNFENADERCGTASVTTGYGAGVAVGTPAYASTSTSDIFIVNCQTN